MNVRPGVIGKQTLKTIIHGPVKGHEHHVAVLQIPNDFFIISTDHLYDLTLPIYNRSPKIVTDTRLVLWLPKGVEYRTHSCGQGRMNKAGGRLTWEVGTLASQHAVTAMVRLKFHKLVYSLHIEMLTFGPPVQTTQPPRPDYPFLGIDDPKPKPEVMYSFEELNEMLHQMWVHEDEGRMEEARLINQQLIQIHEKEAYADD